MATIAPLYKWPLDSGEPAKDILSARLRAKYYGAQMITYRPFILKILEVQRPHMKSGELNQQWNQSISDPQVDQENKRILDPQIREYVRKGIKALIHSTTAFHGIADCSRQRLLVTNVWGTAHA